MEGVVAWGKVNWSRLLLMTGDGVWSRGGREGRDGGRQRDVGMGS